MNSEIAPFSPERRVPAFPVGPHRAPDDVTVDTAGGAFDLGTIMRTLHEWRWLILGAVGVGAATALLTVVSGALYARLDAQAFWIMAALCALALPLSWKLRL